MANKFQARHFEEIARIVRKWQDSHVPNHIEVRQIVGEFAEAFAADNPKFNKARFINACVEPSCLDFRK